ncbi:hypothetical protein [Nocardia wallacei]|uniref:hypothetical protein n=1 Tax=Nocardia wallacei TaxID=480035 RepID=UPI002454B9E1|nr:hypothetical protein [Nocardia wallacei]
MEENNWSVARQTVGYFHYGTEPELLLLNDIYATLRLQVTSSIRIRSWCPSSESTPR